MKQLLLTITATVFLSLTGSAQVCDLFFSEYLEGSSNNKAIEFYNPLNVTVDLDDYVVYRYNNGSPIPTDSLFPQGTLAPGAVYVAGNPSAVAAILAVSDTLHTITFFNGDDAMELVHRPTGTSLDVIGIIGNDPGTNWPVGSGATSEFTLVRQFAYTDGETNWAISATEWDVYPASAANPFIGSHSGAPCCAPTTSSFSATGCSSYVWSENGETYTTSGSYNDTLVNAEGCDSIITLNLTINLPTTAGLIADACNSYTWAFNGTTYFTSGSYNDTIQNAAGCDSIITLTLTINQPTTSSLMETACTSYTWPQNGMTYMTSGNYNDTIPNAIGCDSIITLNLTINPPTTSNLSASACETYTWAENGMMYTTSGSYNDTIPNAAGCDSIITLNLTINQPAASFVTASACDTYTWNSNGMTYTVSGWYLDTLSTVEGCDSIVTLELTIVSPPTANATDNGAGTLTGSGGTPVQWINCATNTAIAGETAATFSPSANGNYAIVVSNGSCTDTSDCVLIDYIGLNENQLINAGISPNPATDEVKITFTGTSAIMIIRDAQGKLIQRENIENGAIISLVNVQTGIYFFELMTEQGKAVKRVVKN
ncbi:MAG: T9SS type A sorting domain-containing protein [Bacteroidota bacterium]